jgi:stearoyl-CoA desaturase (delta-9 desaturase)
MSAGGDERDRLDVLFTLLNLTSTAGATILLFVYHSRSSVMAFAVTYTICGLGLTAGYHRLFAHRSYAVPRWLEHAIATCGYLALQRGPIFWVAMHRRHHKYADVAGMDPHTPREGLWHVHFGWIQRRRDSIWDPELYRARVPELVKDRLYLWMDDERHDYLTNFAWILLSLAAGGWIGARFRGFDWHNAICFAVWVGLFHRVALLQAFGLINSVCHLVGTRAFHGKTAGLARNNYFVSLVIFGEGWHNNHHAFPQSARQGLRFWQLDIAWYFIWLLQWVGLATDVKLPSAEATALRAGEGGGG